MNEVASKQMTALSIASAEKTGDLVIAPQNFGEVLAFSEMMAQSQFVPAAHRNKPGNCLAVCMQALRWSLDPFMVAQKTYFVKEGAPPAYEAQLINAVVYARAPLDGRLTIEWTGAWPKRVCTVTGYIKGDPKPKTRAVEAIGIQTRNSPLWKTDPDQQLAYYATRAWARLYCPDVIMGAYTRDEIGEGLHATPETAKDITPPASKLDALEELIGGNGAKTETAEEPQAEIEAVSTPGYTESELEDALAKIDEVSASGTEKLTEHIQGLEDDLRELLKTHYAKSLNSAWREAKKADTSAEGMRA
jgi:RecT family protein